MEFVIYSVLILFGLGLVAAALLAVASRVFHVEEDPRIEAVLEALPGANCGGCGYAGCEGYATAVVRNPSVEAGLCVAGGAEVSIAVGDLTGKVVAASEPLRSFRRCQKIEGRVSLRYEYQGMPSCAAATLLIGGTDLCTYSCLGYGDCVKVCPFNAMVVEDRLVRIVPSRCTGCGMCTKVCPRGILELIPVRSRVMAYCATRDKLRAVMEICDAGCINCGKCVKTCPAGAVTSVRDRVEIDHMRCLSYGPECGEACMESCPRGILRPFCENRRKAGEVEHPEKAPEDAPPPSRDTGNSNTAEQQA